MDRLFHHAGESVAHHPLNLEQSVVGKLLKALDLAKAGNWDAAHAIVQQRSDRLSCLIHGYLHRVERDLGNAEYWYKRAGEALPDNSLEEELRRLYDEVRPP